MRGRGREKWCRALVTVPPIVPVPARVAPLETVTAPAARLPFTTRAPAETAVGPEYVFAPSSTSVPLPALTRLLVVAPVMAPR